MTWAVVSTMDEGQFVRLFPDKDAAERWAVDWLKMTQPATASIKATLPADFLREFESYLGITEWLFVAECEDGTKTGLKQRELI
jgi:hypothetical protein